MTLNWVGIGSALASVVLFTWFVGIGKRRGNLFLPQFIALLFSLPGLSFIAYYFHVLPETAAYYEFRSWQGSEFFIALIGPAFGLLASHFSPITRTAVFIAVVAFSVGPFMKPILAPLHSGDFRERWKNDVCMQSTAATCGPASVATILRHVGIDANELDLATRCCSYMGGTEAWYLARTVRTLGCEAVFDFGAHPTDTEKLPAVLGVVIGGAGHFIAVTKFEDGRYFVADPITGGLKLTEDELQRLFQFTSFRLVIRLRDPI